MTLRHPGKWVPKIANKKLPFEEIKNGRPQNWLPIESPAKTPRKETQGKKYKMAYYASSVTKNTRCTSNRSYQTIKQAYTVHLFTSKLSSLMHWEWDTWISTCSYAHTTYLVFLPQRNFQGKGHQVALLFFNNSGTGRNQACSRRVQKAPATHQPIK